MSKCWSITRDGNRCKNRKIPFSRYCFVHQDVSWVFTLFVTVIIALSVGWWQIREPFILVECDVLPDGNPSILECTVTNTGRGEAKDVLLAFTSFLPLDTGIEASPELGISILETEAPPHPEFFPNLMSIQRAFVVSVPRVPARGKIQFRVRTTNPDNVKASQQIMRLRNKIAKVIHEFGGRVTESYPEVSSGWVFNDVFGARVKKENLFNPGKYSYENGSFAIRYLTEAEETADALQQDLYSRFKPEFIEVFAGGPRYKAPVIRIYTNNGEDTYAIFPPYIKTGIMTSFSVKELMEKGEVSIRAPVPENYE